jgi:hypothetical protein
VSGSNNGIAVTVGTPQVRISNVVVTQNGVGITVGGTGASFLTFNNNKIAGNGTGNALPSGSTIIAVQ